MKRTSWVLISVSSVLLSCGEHIPTSGGIGGSTEARPTISDAATGGRAGFYFLAPLATTTAYGGTFDSHVSPTVEICVVDGGSCTSTIATYAMSSGSGDETVRLDATNELYTVTWHTARFSLDPARTYRIRVLLWSMVLGYADVDVVAKGSEIAGVNRRDFIPLVNGASLPIKFRVEESATWAGLALLTLSRSNAPPGATLELTGFDPGAAPPNELALFIANRPTSVNANGNGALVAGVPLFLGADLWPAPPAGAQDVILLRNGIPVAGARRALTVTPLQDAPGASQRALTALETLASGFSAIASELPVPASAEEGYYASITGALGAMIGGSDARSLKSVLQNLATTDPRVLRLLDAWLSSSGAVNALQQFAGYLQGLSLSATSSRAASPAGRTAHGTLMSVAVTPTVTSDIELAKKMQLYEIVKLFSETVISGTNATFSNYIANIAGFIAFAQVGVANAPSLTPVAVTAALLAMTDFVANKVIVALMPANIVTFDLSVASSQLNLGELTDATLRIVAANSPPTVGINDVVGLILAGLGALPAPNVQTFTQGLQAVASFYLNLMQSLLSQFAAAHPALSLDVSLAQLVPAMQWEAVVTDRRLVERSSQTPAIIDGDLVEVNWRASQTTPGTGRIFAVPSLSPAAILISPPAGIVYTGGAFGDDILSSNVVTVQVGGATVTVSPGTAALAPLGTRQFSATVTGLANTAVTWSTDDPGGVVTSGGFYTAGATPGIYSVTATSVGDPTRSGSATVQVQSTATMSITPDVASIALGGTRQFSATVLGVANTQVTWTATGGTISNTGYFTAGNATGTFTVTATSVAVPSLSAVANIQIVVTSIHAFPSRNELSVVANAGVDGYLLNPRAGQTVCAPDDDFSGLTTGGPHDVPTLSWNDDPNTAVNEAGTGSAWVLARQNTVVALQPTTGRIGDITFDGEGEASATLFGGFGTAGATAQVNAQTCNGRSLRQGFLFNVQGTGTLGFVLTMSCMNTPVVRPVPSSTAGATARARAGLSAIFGTISQTSGTTALQCPVTAAGSQSVTVTGRLSPGVYLVGGEAFVQAIADRFVNGSYSGTARFTLRLELTP